MAISIDSSQGRVVHEGAHAPTRPPQGMVFLEAEDLSGYQAELMVFWRLKRAFLPSEHVRGGLVPDLVQIRMDKASAPGAVPLRLPDGGFSKERLDFSQHLTVLHNKGFLRIDTVCGPGWEEKPGSEGARRMREYAAKLEDPKVLAELMRRGWNPTADALRYFDAEIQAGARGTRAFNAHLEKALENAEEARNLWIGRVKEALAILEAEKAPKVEPAPEAEKVARVEPAPAAEKVAKGKAKAEPKPEPTPDSKGGA